MPYTKETRRIFKLKRSVAISYLAIFFLLIWVKRKYDDENIYFEISNSYQTEIIEKDDIINKLNKEIDSLKGLGPKKQNIISSEIKEKKKIEKKSEDKNKIIKEVKVDSIPDKIEIDSLKTNKL
jgi:uncharacterized protein YxeA